MKKNNSPGVINKINRLIRILLNYKFDYFVIFIFTLIFYIKNLSPSVYGGDSGDMIMAALVKGIPHPSGYPLHTLLGMFFLSLPISATAAWKVGFVSAVFSSLTVLVIYLTSLELTKRRVLSVLTALSVAFTYSFWLYAEVVEVFALYSFFISILTYLTIRYINSKNDKDLYLLAFFTGLSLTNNQAIVVLFPFMGITILLTDWKILLNLKKIIKLILLFILGLTPYIYIPIAALQYPAMNWGFAVNFENFWYLVTRQYYGWGGGVNTVKMNYTSENILIRMGTYVDYWKSYINPLTPILILLGIINTVIDKKFKLLFFILFSYLFFGPLFMIFSGSDFKSYLALATIERFLISNIIISFLFLPLGIIFLERIITNLPKVRGVLKKYIKYLIVIIVFLIPTISFLINIKRTNFSDVHIGDDLARDILSNLPENSVLMLQNDSIAFNTIYYQEAYNFRKDVVIPGMHNGFRRNLEAMGMGVDQINNSIIKNKGDINKKIFDESITNLMSDGVNVFVDGMYTINKDSDDKKIVAVPFGLLYKFEFYKNLPYPKESYIGIIDKITKSYQFESFAQHEEVLSYSLIYSDIKKVYSADLFRISEYIHNQYNDYKALDYLIKSIMIDPLGSSQDNQ